MKEPLVIAFLLAIVGAGCSGSHPQPGDTAQSTSSQETALVGPTWQLVTFGEAADSQSVMEKAEITAVFSEAGRVTGSAGCNRYFGSYERSGNTLTISQVGATRKACSSPIMEQERAYLSALTSAKRWTRQEDQLNLISGDGERLLHFEVQVQEGNAANGGAMNPQPTGETSVFVCTDPDGEDFRFTVRTGPGELALWLPERFGERYLVLGQVRAASGAKYEGDGVTVWNKGNEALLEVAGETHTGCTLDPRSSIWEEAKRSGVDFRAVGNEPGWHLEIREGERIRFVYAYGEREAVVPTPEPTVDEDARRTVYRAETEIHDLTVTIEGQPCTDSMSGERFEAAVTVMLDDETYRGCGRTLD